MPTIPDDRDCQGFDVLAKMHPSVLRRAITALRRLLGLLRNTGATQPRKERFVIQLDVREPLQSTTVHPAVELSLPDQA